MACACGMPPPVKGEYVALTCVPVSCTYEGIAAMGSESGGSEMLPASVSRDHLRDPGLRGGGGGERRISCSFVEIEIGNATIHDDDDTLYVDFDFGPCTFAQSARLSRIPYQVSIRPSLSSCQFEFVAAPRKFGSRWTSTSTGTPFPLDVDVTVLKPPSAILMIAHPYTVCVLHPFEMRDATLSNSPNPLSPLCPSAPCTRGSYRPERRRVDCVHLVKTLWQRLGQGRA
eukprot:scaffold42685_cov281-Isochrysis_galbana.AAC.1